METNLEILGKLYEIGREVFDGLEIEDGNFTAGELAKRKNIRRKRSDWGQKLYEIESGNFRCSFSAFNVFEIISKFETICGIPCGKRIKFLRGSLEDLPKSLTAMYIDSKNKVVCKKKKMIQYNDIVAVGIKNDRYVYFRSGNVWYPIWIRGYGDKKEDITKEVTREKVRSNLYLWFMRGYSNKYTPIFSALYQSMQAAM